MHDPGDFEKGRQPCSSFKPREGPIPGVQNRHECYKCGGLVSFCESCCFDHHKDGYETCKGEVKGSRQGCP